MAQRALTLKYRPQVFSDMVGQEHVSGVLERALATGRVAHGYLFTGARGVGKTTSARILAKALNCLKRASGEQKGPDPCNTCTSCVEITNGSSLDVIEIDGASNRGIADVQALREKVRFTPTGGRYRVVIIDEVHQLSGDAFAALLKTLEEPPPHLVFIFATTDPQKVPDTIRSRTQRFDFARVPVRKIVERLLDLQRREAADADGVKFTLSEDAALLIAHKSEGSVRDAVSALDQVVSSGESTVDEALVRRILGIADREAFFRIVDAIVQHDPQATLRALHEAYDKGMDPRDLAEGIGEHVRHVLVLKVDPQGGELVPASREEMARLKKQGEGWSDHDLLRLLRIASEALTPMKDSPQPLVHLEAAALQMATLEPGETLATLLDRLESLERRLNGGGDGGPARGTPSTGRAPAGTRRAPESGTSAAAPTPATATPTAVPPSTPAPSAGAPSAGYIAQRMAGAPRPDAIATSRPNGPAATPRPSVASRPMVAGPSAAPLQAGSPRPSSAPTQAFSPRPSTAPAPARDEPLVRDAETEARWRQVLEGINARKRLLGAFLEESFFLGRTGDALVVAMDDLHRAVIDEKDNRGLVMDEVRRVFGQPLAVRGAPLDAAGSLAQRPTLEQTQAMVAKTLAWFGGEAAPPDSRRAAEGNPG